MNFKEWTQRLSNFIDILEQERERTAIENASNIMALLQQRIINDRINASRQPFGTYSRAVVPFWYFGGQDTRRASANALSDLYEKTGYFASYADWREVNNLLGDELNFSFTGEMWKSMKTVVVDSGKDIISVGWVFDDPEKDTIFGYHLNRFPDLLDLSPDEEQILREMSDERILKAAQKAGLI